MTQKSTEKTGNSLMLIFKVAFAILAFLLILKECGGRPAMAAKSEKVYEVIVKVRLGNSWSSSRQIVQARSSFDAQKIAQTQARYQIKTSVSSCKEIR